MKKVVFGLLALAAVVAISDSAEARDRRYSSRSQRVSRNNYVQQPVQYSEPQQGYYYEQQERPSFFGSLIEMENRKNAWLRRTFFGE